MDPPGTQLFSAVDAAKRIWPERRQNGCPQEAKSLMAGRRGSALKDAEKHWQIFKGLLSPKLPRPAHLRA